MARKFAQADADYKVIRPGDKTVVVSDKIKGGKWIKYALYQREQLHDARLPADRQMTLLTRLGERLGELQDLCNLEAQLQRSPASTDRDALAARLEQRKHHCKRRIIRLFIRTFGRGGFRC